MVGWKPVSGPLRAGQEGVWAVLQPRVRFPPPLQQARGRSGDEVMDEQEAGGHHGGFQIHKGFSAEGKTRALAREQAPEILALWF